MCLWHRFGWFSVLNIAEFKYRNIVTGDVTQTNNSTLEKYCSGSSYVNCQTDGTIVSIG